MALVTTAPTQQLRIARLFSYPFRVFFLSAAAFGLLAIPAWLLMLMGGWQHALSMTPFAWHQHELLFGFLEAAIAGFLLTAVCNWTDTVRTHGAALAALWAVWLAGRVLMFAPFGAPDWLVTGIDLAFLPLVMLDAGHRIARAKQHRHWIVLVVLGLIWLMDVGFHFAPGLHFAHGALIMAMTLMLVIGGRITPAFSANWLRMNGGDPSAIRIVPVLERITLATMLLLLIAVVIDVSAVIRSTLALFAALLSATRLVLWQGWRVRKEPLLWILHLSLAWIPIALLLMSGSAAGCVAPSAWVHAASIGAMASLIIGVMSRVALGHTGRPLKLPAGMPTAFVLMLIAGVARVAVALRLLDWQFGVILTASLWIVAFATFLRRYALILASPRFDGKPG